MSATTPSTATPRGSFLIPTATKQAWGFMIGSSFFAIGSAPVVADALGSTGSNLLFFVGAWFFTTAGLMQLFLSGAVSVPVAYGPGRMVRAEWLTAATQSFGTIMFNVSTTAALYAKSTRAEEEFVWNPDAGGSVAFLVSGFFAFVAFSRAGGSLTNLASRSWWSVFINFVGCVAFGISAVGAFILPSGETLSDAYATWGTFIGAICFFLASLIVLPQWDRPKAGATAVSA